MIKITQRGPTAFTIFKAICQKDFIEAAEILKQRPVEGNGTSLYGGVVLSVSDSKKENERERREMYEGQCVSKLKASTSKSTVDGNKNEENIRLEPYDGPIKRVLDVKRATKFCTSTEPDIKTYSMRSKHRGVLFLVNIIDFPLKDKKENRRNGAEVDKDFLLDLFNQMGFKLFYYENINAGQFSSLIKQLSSSNNLRMADSLVFALLTHGRL